MLHMHKVSDRQLTKDQERLRLKRRKKGTPKKSVHTNPAYQSF